MVICLPVSINGNGQAVARKGKAMQQGIQAVIVIQAIAGDDLPDAGMKVGTTIYLAWDRQTRRFFVVQWDRIRWVCSCGRPGCAHRLATNTYVFERSVQYQDHKPGLKR